MHRPGPRSFRNLLVATLLPLVLACVSPPQATVEEKQAYGQAIAAAKANPAEGARAFEAFLRQHPESALAADAASRRADLALTANQPSTAIFWLRWLVRNHPEADGIDAVRLELASLSYEFARDRETASSALDGLRIEKLSHSDRRRVYRLRALLSDDPVDRVRWLAKARVVALSADVLVESQALIDAELQRAVDALSSLDLLRAADRLDGRIPAGRVALRLASMSLDSGDLASARHELESAEQLELIAGEDHLLTLLQGRLASAEAGLDEGELLPSFESVAMQVEPSTEGASGSIGVVVPLTGPFASYGEESLRGVLLAAGIFDPIANGFAADEPMDSDFPEGVDAPYSNGDVEGLGYLDQGLSPEQALSPEQDRQADGVRVLVRDNAGDPARTAVAVSDLASDEHVMAIIGPLRATTSEAAANVAQSAEIPLIALTTREEVPRDRPNVFRVRTTPDDELRYLIDYAFEQEQVERFAILYPDDGYGRGMRDTFFRMVEERGGWMTAMSAYKPDATDFGEAIRDMIGYALLKPREVVAMRERDAFLRRGRRLPPEDSLLVRELADELIGPAGQLLPPIVDFEALFVPDSYQKIGLLAPQLAFNEVTDVLLLGTGDWVHPELVEIAQEHVDGAVISARFDPNSRFPFVARFVDDFRDVYELEPTDYAAHAYDAANLVLVQLAGGQESRSGVREGVLRVQAYPGASGVLSISSDGNARKRPFLLQVRGNHIAPLD